MKIMKIFKYPDVEVSLFKWFSQFNNSNIPINEPILKEKAEFFCY
jgi:hypothetical protein